MKTWLPTNPICTVFIICINRGRIDTFSLIAPISFPHLTTGVCTVLQNLIWSVTTQRHDFQQKKSAHLSLLIATEEELISLNYLQIDQWTSCYCAPELYNKSSILRNIDNWNTKTTNINTITFSITFQFKIHQIQRYSKQNKKRKENKRKQNLFTNTHNNIEFRETQNKKKNKRKHNIFTNTHNSLQC